jgi:DNA invertase Pin-like site-specific DNA recombinase
VIQPSSSWEVLRDGRVSRAGARPRGGKGWRRPLGRTGRQRLTKDQALEIRRRVTAGESRRDVAAAFSVSEDTVGSIAAGHTWRRA